MQTGDRVVYGDNIVPLFPEVECELELVPAVQIGRLRWLMLAFASVHVLTGIGPFVASRLDLSVGLRYVPNGPFITMLQVYFAARSVGLIVDQDGRETPDPDFVRRARGLHVVPCKTCGVGERESENSRCWVCDAREERRIVAEAAATCRRVSCQP